MEYQVKIKGITLLSRLKLIEEEFGEDVRQQAVEEMHQAFGALTTGIILPISWYPLAMDNLLCRFIQKRWGLPEEQAFFQLGQRSAREHQKMFAATFIGCQNPIQVLERMPRLNKHFVEGMGRLVFEPVSNEQALLHLEDLAVASRSHCISTMGFIAESCLLYSGREVEARHVSCKAEGKSRCSFLFLVK